MRGKVKIQQNGGVFTPDHPRVCGEKLLFLFDAASFIGSPPRMRGKDAEILETAKTLGITPAYAGKSLCEVYVYSFC